MSAVDGVAEARSACDEIAKCLVALDRWPTLGLPSLSDAERGWVHSRLDQLAAERVARSDARRERLAKTATYLGREVACHRVLLSDAERRLQAMALAMDPDTDTPILLVPYAEAIAIIEASFSTGYRSSARPDLGPVA